MHDPVDHDTAAMISRAAKGDPDAQGAIADWAMEMADKQAMPFGHCAHLAEAFARMAASHGRPDDRLRLGRALLYAAQDAGNVADRLSAQSHQAEALALFNELADEGHEDAEGLLQSAADLMSPGVIANAGRLRRANTPGASFFTYADTAPNEGAGK